VVPADGILIPTCIKPAVINQTTMQISTIKTLLAAGLALCIIACNNSAKKEKKDKQADTAVTEVPPPPPPANNPPGVEMKPAINKCFTSDGLKYKTTINLNMGDADCLGTVTSEELESGKKESADFTGVISGEGLVIKFKGEPPVVGAASEWTDKIWTIKKTGNKETLHIIFNAKNYETNKWQDMDYEFQQADCK